MTEHIRSEKDREATQIGMQILRSARVNPDTFDKSDLLDMASDGVDTHALPVLDIKDLDAAIKAGDDVYAVFGKNVIRLEAVDPDSIN